MRDIKPENKSRNVLCKMKFPLLWRILNKELSSPCHCLTLPWSNKILLGFLESFIRKRHRHNRGAIEVSTSGKSKSEKKFRSYKIELEKLSLFWIQVCCQLRAGHYPGLGLTAGYNINYFLTCNFLKLSQIEVDKIQDLSSPSLKCFTRFKERRGH